MAKKKKLEKLHWHVERRKLDSLADWEKNPRRLLPTELEHLTNSIEKFGVVEPLVCQPDGTLIGGHARKRVLSEQGYVEADCYVPNRALTDKEHEELCVRLNKNIAGMWDMEKLAENISSAAA